MKVPISHKLHNQQLWLSFTRCIYWEDQRTLILSDIHLGKTGHFRKSGIAIPQSVYKEDLQRLVNDIQYFQPSRLVVVGDMFHSTANKEHDYFLRWRDNFPDLEICLVKGNHDILKPSWYQQSGIQLYNPTYSVAPFLFCHETPDACKTNANDYVVTGHLHPGIVLTTKTKQSLRFPCYYFSTDYAVLPAYSRFTGMATISPGANDQVFAIVDENVIEI